MKKTLKKVLAIVLTVAIMATLGVGALAADNCTISSVNLTKTSMVVGETGTASVTVAPEAACATPSYTYTSSDPTIVSVTGTTYAALKSGTATISAKCNTCDANQVSATITVKCCSTAGCTCADGCTGGGTCKCAACTAPTVALAAAGNDPKVAIDGTKAITATVTYPSCGTCKTRTIADSEVAWTVTAGSGNIEMPLTTTGKTLTVTGKAAGKATLKATYTTALTDTETTTGDKARTAEKTIDITVTPKAPTVTRAQGSVATYYAVVGGTHPAMSVAATPAADTGVTRSFQWYEDLATDQKVGTNSATFTAPEYARTEAGKTHTYYCVVKDTLNSDASVYVEARSPSFTVRVYDKYEVTITPATPGTVTVNGSVRLAATVEENQVRDNAKAPTKVPVSNPTINWLVNNTTLTFKTGSYATTDSATATGTYVYVYGKAFSIAGSPAKATYTKDGVDYSKEVTVKVQDEVVVTLGRDTASVIKGNTTTDAQVATVYDKTVNKYAYTTRSNTGYTYSVTYESSNSNIASVDYNGTVTGKALGKATITATVTVKNNTNDTVAIVEKTCEVSVISGDYDVYYNVRAGSTVSMNENDFINWFRTETYSNYYLNYVTFDSVSTSSYRGTFKNGTNSFYPYGSSYRFYTSNAYVTGSQYYLKNNTYTSSAYDGVIAVSFTAYGGNSTSAYNITRTGTMYICVTSGTVSDIKYDVSGGASKTMGMTDFTGVLNAATGAYTTPTGYYAQLIDLPTMGTLYKDYATNGRTIMTAYNLGGYSFKLGSNLLANEVSIDDLTYVPAAAKTGGTDTFHYAVYNYANVLQYIGTVTFTYAKLSFDVYSDGRTFSYTDFYNKNDADPIVSVKFVQPTTGRLYKNYAYGTGTLVASTDEFYTYTAATGKTALSTVTYIPKAGSKGEVAITYTATTAAGKTYTSTLTMKVLTKTASSQFTDVTAKGVGTWAADAIDYAEKWDLVNGTGTYTFAPNAAMTRGQLVTILWRAAGSPAPSSTNPFTDVKDTSAYYYKAVLWAYQKNIVSGTSATKFNPSGKVTREQIAKIIYGFADYVGTPSGSSSLTAYKDYAKVSSYAVTAMQWAVGNGIVTGMGDGTLSPAKTATRAQVAVMLHRFLADK